MHQRCIAPECPDLAEIGAVFCVSHLQAPTGKRGGWISAERRRRMRGGSMETPLDASCIVRRLWVGSRPPFDRHLPEFDVVALCAEELQPQRIAFDGHVIRVPLPDATLTALEISRALTGGREVARALANGQRVLVTCAAGLNRSALVAGLGLGMCSRLSADEIIYLMRKKRSHFALNNACFVDVIKKFIGSGRTRGR